MHAAGCVCGFQVLQFEKEKKKWEIFKKCRKNRNALHIPQIELVHLVVYSTSFFFISFFLIYLLLSFVNVIGNLFKCHQCKRRICIVYTQWQCVWSVNLSLNTVNGLLLLLVSPPPPPYPPPPSPPSLWWHRRYCTTLSDFWLSLFTVLYDR